MSQLGERRERIGRRDADSKRKKRKVENRYMEGRRRKDESDMVFDKGWEFGKESQREGFNLGEKLGVRETVAGRGVDEERGGWSGGVRWGIGGVEKVEGVLGERERLGERW